MRDVVFQRLRDSLGEPNRATVKDWRWELPLGLSVMLEKEVCVATVWLPWPFGDWPCPEYGEVYEATRGRNTGTFALPGIERDRPVMRLKLESTTAMEETMHRIEAMKGRGAIPR